jgi:bacillithiol system protein YtxJ
MKWTVLDSEDQLETIREESKTQPIVIFKHSTTCNISSMMLSRLERSWKPEQVPSVKPYFLDLRAYRAVSNSVASFFETEHESPQMLIIRDGKPVNVTSHFEIDFGNVKEAIAE